MTRSGLIQTYLHEVGLWLFRHASSAFNTLFFSTSPLLPPSVLSLTLVGISGHYGVVCKGVLATKLQVNQVSAVAK